MKPTILLLVCIIIAVSGCKVKSYSLEKKVELLTDPTFYNKYGVQWDFLDSPLGCTIRLNSGLTSRPLKIPPLIKDSVYTMIMEVSNLNLLDSTPIVYFDIDSTKASGSHLKLVETDHNFYLPPVQMENRILLFREYIAEGGENKMEIGIGVGEFNAFILTDEGRHHNENLFNSSYCLEKVYLFKGHAKRFLFIDREPMFETTEQVENLSSGDNVHELKQVPKRRNPKLDGNMRVDEHHNLIQD